MSSFRRIGSLVVGWVLFGGFCYGVYVFEGYGNQSAEAAAPTEITAGYLLTVASDTIVCQHLADFRKNDLSTCLRTNALIFGWPTEKASGSHVYYRIHPTGVFVADPSDVLGGGSLKQIPASSAPDFWAPAGALRNFAGGDLP